ncbi:MAG: MATE family efflux transporter [Eubacteriales bacterium]|nr:MATE family efflux transporter [Eubacteriales bacterium]
MTKDLTRGSVTGTMIVFALPMILGNFLQQCYNIADTLIVGHYLGAGALAAVGSAYTLMTFLTSILMGLCMGSGSVFSLYFGRGDLSRMGRSIPTAFVFIGSVTLVINVAVCLNVKGILRLLQVPADVFPLMEEYVRIIFLGIFFVFLYNFFSFLLRSVGNSVTPLYFLGGAAVLNIALDLWFVAGLHRGIAGAAEATVLAQMVSGLGLGLYTWVKEPSLRPRFGERAPGILGEILRFSTAACIQQSVMNFGILMIQGLVNSFGTAVMAAFAAAVKIDAFAYMPAQEFGSAFSLFTSQNHGAGAKDRVAQGVRSAVRVSVLFCLGVSALIFLTAPALMGIFIDRAQGEIIAIGAQYLRIEGAFYFGIGVLFLLYGYFRGIGRPEMSIVLTVISLGTRVLLAYALAPVFGVEAIWWSIPIGWGLADLVGLLCLKK